VATGPSQASSSRSPVPLSFLAVASSKNRCKSP
jgi:hypothetical protein